MADKPFEITDCTATNLRKMNRLITTMYDHALKPCGLRSTQFTLLATLQMCGQSPLSQLAEVLVTERTTLTRNLKPLVEKNYIVIEGEEDRRVKLISLTKEGEAILKSAMPLWQTVQENSIKLLGREHWEEFIRELQVTTDKLSP